MESMDATVDSVKECSNIHGLVTTRARRAGRHEVVKIDYRGQPAHFDEDGWLNATTAAERYGRRVDHYLANAETKDYLAALCEDENTRKVGYFIKTRRGRNGNPWFHPDLVVHFARWLDVHFAIWCDRQIRALIPGQHPHNDWKKLRHETASSFKVLQMTRERLGKTCAPYHFSNEARLITGRFGRVD
jgi:hypothetical protein